MTIPTYRPDIDGLPAIAVLSVLFYHSGFDVVGGGYVGVDVFFVISGFLITTIIARELRDGSFSIAGFYERRMRRILPASIVTVAVCLLVGFLVFETEDMGRLANSAIANSFFLSNIYFYLQTGYFDAAAELKPLLHTWSLSLEEQYYVVTPLLLLVIARFFNQRHMLFIVPIAILSFAACVYGTAHNPSGTFYMLWTRGWELLIGSILAISAMMHVWRISNEKVLTAMAVLGLGMVLFSIFAFDDETAFPGAHAAIPTLGTGLLIYTGLWGMTPVNRMLSIRPMVFVGLIVDLEWRRWRACENVEERLAEGQGLCVAGAEGAEPAFIPWGDSHARAFNSAVHASGQRLGVAGYVASKPGCAPLRGIERDSRPDCSEFNESLLSFIEDNPNIETVVLAAHWTGVAEVARYMDEGGERATLRDTLAGTGADDRGAAG